MNPLKSVQVAGSALFVTIGVWLAYVTLRGVADLDTVPMAGIAVYLGLLLSGVLVIMSLPLMVSLVWQGGSYRTRLVLASTTLGLIAASIVAFLVAVLIG